MNFEKVELYGFKSFADKAEIKFGEGITGIVGPNGCGKSNVADAIRWVLGEQSAKSLRGSSMSDVIFSGTQGRKSLSYCEVSLYFDNSNKMFSIDYNEENSTIDFKVRRIARYKEPFSQIVLNDFMNYLSRQALPNDFS